MENIQENNLYKTIKTACTNVINENKTKQHLPKHIIQTNHLKNKNLNLFRYLEDLENKTKALVFVSTNQISNFKKLITKKNKSKFIFINSKTSKKLDNLNTSQILIISNEHYLINKDNDYTKKRDLIIIDDTIELFHPYSLQNNQLKVLKKIVDSSTKQYKKEIKNELDILNKFVFLCNGIHLETSSKKKKTFLVNDKKNMKNISFLKIKKLIKSTNCGLVALDKSLEKDQEIKYKKELLRSLDTLEVLSSNWFYYFTKDFTLKNSSLNTISSKIIDKSLVILTSVSKSNYLYSLFSNSVLYKNEEKIDSKIDLNINKTIDISIESLLKKPHHNANVLLSNLQNKIDKKTSTLIITNNKFSSYLLDFKTTYKYSVESFENINNIKDIDKFDNIVIYSLPIEECTSYINQHCNIASNLDDIEDITITQNIKQSTINNKIINILNNAKENVTIYLTIGKDKQNSLLDNIKTSSNKIKTKNWSIKNKDISKLKKVSWTNSIISYLHSNIVTSKDLTSVEVMKEVNVPKSTFNKLCAKEEFQEALKKNKLELRLPNNAQRGKVFYKL